MREAPRPGSWTNWRYIVPLVVASAAWVVMVTAFWNGRSRYSSGPGPLYVREPTFVAPGFSVGELQKIASGEVMTKGELSRALMAKSSNWLVRPPGEEYLRVQFHPADGMRSEKRVYGGVMPFVTSMRDGEYLDALNATPLPAETLDVAWQNVSPMGVTATQMLWDNGRLNILRGGAATPYMRDRTVIDVIAIVGVIALAAAGWWIGVGAAGVLTRGMERDRRRRIGRGVGMACAGVVVVGMAGEALLSPEFEVTASPGSFSLRSAMIQQNSGAGQQPALQQERLTDITYRWIVEGEGAEGDRRLAERLLDDGRSYPGEWRLCASFMENSTRGGTDIGLSSPWPLLSVQVVKRWYSDPHAGDGLGRQYGGFRSRGTRRAPTTEERITWPRAGSVVRVESGQLQWALGRSATTQELHAVMVDIGGVLCIATVVWATWAATRVVCARRVRLITRSRLAAHQCVACGYPIDAEFREESSRSGA